MSMVRYTFHGATWHTVIFDVLFEYISVYMWLM